MMRAVCFEATSKVDEDPDGPSPEDAELIQKVQDEIGHTGAVVHAIVWSEIPA